MARMAHASPGRSEEHIRLLRQRAAAERDVTVTMLSDCQCLCTTMYRIEPRNLLWVLDSLAAGNVVNRIAVHPEARVRAQLALDRMLAHVGDGRRDAILTVD